LGRFNIGLSSPRFSAATDFLGFFENSPKMKPKNKQNTVDLYYMEARSKLIDIAAFMDRVERDGFTDDFRYLAFKDALKELDSDNRTRKVLLSLSDPTKELIPVATTKAACGAWPDKPQ
jgi:hypothetical protein